MYKIKLQELCQRKRWNLPEYTTVKEGLDHLPRFKAIAMVNGLNFETSPECKSAKEAQNSAAKMAYDHCTVSTPPRIHGQPPVPVSPLPSSLPLPPPGLLAPNNSALIEPVHKDMQPSLGDKAQNSLLYRAPIGSGGALHMYKNRLQQYAQKRNFGLPVYTYESEGPPHARRFKSRVSFDGKSYETMEFFPTLKEAEHAVAMIACQMLQIDQSQEDGGLYKNLLQELAQKRGLLCPTYDTVRSGPPHRSVFVSIVEVGSSTFRGDEAKNKKQAEMNAATVAYYALTEALTTEYSKASSSMECVVSDNLTQRSPPTETTKQDEFLANEEIEVNAKKVKCSPENETASLSALLLPEVSSAQVEHQPVTEPVSGQHEAQRTFCSKTVVFPRKSDFPIPDGASVMSCSDDQWVAYKVELNQEPTA
ncbi:double-stranded RNA-binding protein 1-like isoform X2 [Henckelia pumila]|uniref:double-stranded RNA-binding protein 1-like isoform X2 n=1 Tax=Henckelia pumila TaxID=405737 RepID=UPI003C6E6BA6